MTVSARGGDPPNPPPPPAGAARPLAGRTALVVGTSPNIGAGIAAELGRAGARVACVDRDPHLACLAAKDITGEGGQACAIGWEAPQPADVSRAVAEAEQSLGLVDLLVNGAVRYAVRGLLDMDFGQWKEQLAVLLDSAFLFSSAVARRLVAAGHGGAIVNVISTAGHQGEPGNIGYTTAK